MSSDPGFRCLGFGFCLPGLCVPRAGVLTLTKSLPYSFWKCFHLTEIVLRALVVVIFDCSSTCGWLWYSVYFACSTIAPFLVSSRASQLGFGSL